MTAKEAREIIKEGISPNKPLRDVKECESHSKVFLKMLDKNEKTMLPSLLGKLCQLPGDFKIRVGMMNPNHVMPVLDDMISIYKNEKNFTKFSILYESISRRK